MWSSGVGNLARRHHSKYMSFYVAEVYLDTPNKSFLVPLINFNQQIGRFKKNMLLIGQRRIKFEKADNRCFWLKGKKKKIFSRYSKVFTVCLVSHSQVLEGISRHYGQWEKTGNNRTSFIVPQIYGVSMFLPFQQE